jgi:hypothetical protein
MQVRLYLMTLVFGDGAFVVFRRRTLPGFWIANCDLPGIGVCVVQRRGFSRSLRDRDAPPA